MNSLNALALGLLVIFASGFSAPLWAHDRSESYSRVVFKDGQAKLFFSMPLREARRQYKIFLKERPDFRQDFAQYVSENFKLVYLGQSCVPRGPGQTLFFPGRDRIRMGLNLLCDTKGSNSVSQKNVISLQNTAFLEDIPGHIHITRLYNQDKLLKEALLTRDRHSLRINSLSSPASGFLSIFSDFFLYGMQHISAGADHIIFLLALLLAAGRFKVLILLVSGFTLGHSLTICLAASNLVQVNGTMVEALIGFSIAFAAAEILIRRNQNWFYPALALSLLPLLLLTPQAPLLACGTALFSFCLLYLRKSLKSGGEKLFALVTVFFGLIHGFGFAGGLRELGLPPEGILTALIGFNLGVEAGQLLLLGACALVLAVLKRTALVRFREFAFLLALALIAGVGVFWFVDRINM